MPKDPAPVANACLTFFGVKKRVVTRNCRETRKWRWVGVLLTMPNSLHAFLASYALFDQNFRRGQESCTNHILGDEITPTMCLMRCDMQHSQIVLISLPYRSDWSFDVT